MKAKKLRIVPRGKYVLVKPDAEETRVNQFGLITPSNVEQEQKARGKVIESGKEVPDIKKGDSVVYGVYSGEILKLNEDGKEVEYKLLHTDDIIAFVY